MALSAPPLLNADPAAIRAAAAKLRDAGSKLDKIAATFADSPPKDWTGSASDAFRKGVRQDAETQHKGAGAHKDGAAAMDAFASELERQKQVCTANWKTYQEADAKYRELKAELARRSPYDPSYPVIVQVINRTVEVGNKALQNVRTAEQQVERAGQRLEQDLRKAAKSLSADKVPAPKSAGVPFGYVPPELAFGS